MKYFTQNRWMILTALMVLAFAFVAHHFGLVGHQEMLFMGMAGVMSGSQARVIDPILTNVAQGYQNSDLIGHSLFPAVPVQVSGGQIIEFGRESFRLFNARRSPGGTTKRIEIGYLGKHFSLVQDSLEGKVPREHLRDAARVPGIDLGSRAVNTVMKALKLSLENEQAQLALNASNYDNNHKLTLSGTSKWSTDTGNPMGDIDSAREEIRSTVGIYPNTLVLSAQVFNACKNNPRVIARFQYNSQVPVDGTSITAQMLAGLFNVDKVVIGKAISIDDANVSTDIWGNNAVLAYVPAAPSGMEEPSYGYTYTMEGNPLVEPAYYDNPDKSWIYPVNYERAPVLSGITSGFLIQNPA